MRTWNPHSTSFGQNSILAVMTGGSLLLATAASLANVVGWSGYVHSSVGASQLSIAPDGTLRCSNIGGTGQDGVRIALGDSQGLALDYELGGVVEPAVLTQTRIGSFDDGRPDGEIGSLTTVFEAGTQLLMPNFSGTGSTTYRATVLRNGEVVGVYPGQNEPTLIIDGGHGGHHHKRFCILKPLCRSHIKCAKWNRAFDEDTPMEVGRVHQVVGDEIWFEAEGQCSVSAVREEQITGSGFDEIQIRRSAATWYGAEVSGLGAALVDLQEAVVRVHNLDLTGSDGIQAEFGAVREFSAWWEEPTTQPSARMEFTATGRLSDHSEPPLGALEVRLGAGGLGRISADYSAVGANTVYLEVLNGGQTVATLTGIPNGLVAEMLDPYMPVSCGKAMVTLNGYRTACYRPIWPRPIRFRIAGLPNVLGDELRVLAESPSAELVSLESLSITASGIDELLVTSMEASNRFPGDTNCDGTINNFDIDPFVLALTDPAAYMQEYPSCDFYNADANGDGLVDNFDIDAFVLLLIGG